MNKHEGLKKGVITIRSSTTAINWDHPGTPVHPEVATGGDTLFFFRFATRGLKQNQHVACYVVKCCGITWNYYRTDK